MAVLICTLKYIIDFFYSSTIFFIFLEKKVSDAETDTTH